MTTEAHQPRVLGDMVRALFVAADAFLALLLIAGLVGSIANMSSPSGTPSPDTVAPAIDPGDVVLIGFAALVAVLGLWIAVRQWLRASWHVVTATLLTWATMPAFALIWLGANGIGQH